MEQDFVEAGVMKERIGFRSLWRSSPVAAKVAFGTAIVTSVYYLLFAVTTAVIGQIGGSSDRADWPLPALILIGLMSGLASFGSLAVWAVGPQIIIGLALRARSATARWVGTVAAALIAAVALYGLISMLRNSSPDYQQTGIGAVLEYMLWAPFLAIGAVYAVAALLGFRDATSGGRTDSKGLTSSS